MAISFTDHFKVSKKAYAKSGAFDPILDIDTQLFIDPLLLKKVTHPALKGSYAKLLKRFKGILLLLTKSKVKGDALWREADRQMYFPEVKGLCIGYSGKGTAGSGSGAGIRGHLLETAQAIVQAGVDEPDIFELAGLFEEGIGPDRLSDMTAGVIYEDLKEYTRSVLTEVGAIKKGGPLLTNPFNNTTIILVPKSILRDLPIALDWESVHLVASHNAALRAEVNEAIGETWKQAANRATKADLRKAILAHPELLVDLIEQYRKRTSENYDFDSDPSGRVIWYDIGRGLAKSEPLKLALKKAPSLDDVYKIVVAICDQFRDLVENHNLWKLLYDKGGKVKHEEAAQLLFYGVADAYCAANDIGLNRETNGGRGPVDFKFNVGYHLSVLVEAKLSTNSKLIDGFNKQLPIYKKVEKAKKAIYLVIDVGASEKKLKAFRKVVADSKAGSLEVREVDATPKVSASKA